MSDTYEVAKASAEAAMQPFAELIQKIAGPAAEEIGLTFRDHVKFFRMKRQVRLMERTDEFIKKKGIEPHRVPLKMLATVVENATLEEDDSLQDMWAALLANAATTKEGPEFMLAEILRQLSPADAHLLRECFREIVNGPIDRPADFFLYKRRSRSGKNTSLGMISSLTIRSALSLSRIWRDWDCFLLQHSWLTEPEAVYSAKLAGASFTPVKLLTRSEQQKNNCPKIPASTWAIHFLLRAR